MSFRHVRQLTSIREEFLAARAALALAVEHWPALHTTRQLQAQTLRMMRAADTNLEMTYLVRAFARFEAVLRDHWIAARPGSRLPPRAETLINRVASRHRLPAAIRDAAHRVRRYRNAVAHETRNALPMTLAEALATLNRFVAPLPDV